MSVGSANLRASSSWAWFLFFVCLFLYNINLRYIGSFDSLAASQLPFRLLTGHGLTLQDPSRMPKGLGYSFYRSRSGEWIPFYPVFTPLVITPLYVPAVLLESSHPNLGGRAVQLFMEKTCASLIAALSVSVLFLVLRQITRAALAILLAAAYAFGTSTWAISSQSLWPHGMGELLLALSLLLLLKETPSAGRLAVLGALAGFLAANRPTDVLFSCALALIVFQRAGKAAWPFFVVAGLAGVLLLAYNLRNFGTITGGYGTVEYLRDKENHAFGLGGFRLSGFFGLLFSNRGLFVFSPFLLLALRFRWRSPERLPGLKILLVALIAWLFLHGLAIDWIGGYCYGPRYATNGLPILVASLAEPLERAWRLFSMRVLLAISFVISVAIQAIGAFFYPAGDSGNWLQGLWTIRGSPPIVALEAMKPKIYSTLLAPVIGTRNKLSDSEGACRLEWLTPPRDGSGELQRVLVRVTNLGSKHWSSFGGSLNVGAVRLRTSWLCLGKAQPEVGARGNWVAGYLGPFKSKILDLPVAVPATPGRWLLTAQLVQAQMGPFPIATCRPLKEQILVEP